MEAALIALIDHVDVDSILTVLDFLERTQKPLVEIVSAAPEVGPVFQGAVRKFTAHGYVLHCEYHPSKGEAHVLDMIAAVGG